MSKETGHTVGVNIHSNLWRRTGEVAMVRDIMVGRGKSRVVGVNSLSPNIAFSGLEREWKAHVMDASVFSTIIDHVKHY